MKSFTLVNQTIPEQLRAIAQPPQNLSAVSSNWEDLITRPAVVFVGSRRPSRYGREITRRLAAELARQGIVIVSGLAYGIDSEAHLGALEAGGLTLAVLPAGLPHIYPVANQPLARRIVKQGGALVSEYDETLRHPQKFHFVERNRLIAGFSQVVVVTEATLTSGSRHTVDFALDQGRTVMAVPGRITDRTSDGPHQHLSDGALMVREAADILRALGLSDRPLVAPTSADPDEQLLLHLLSGGSRASPDLLAGCRLAPAVFHQKITMLEINGLVAHTGNDHWRLT